MTSFGPVRVHCTRFGYSWRETYDERHLEDDQGGTWDHYSIAGVLTASPKARTVCRSCHQPTVQRREAANLPVGATRSALATPAPSAPPREEGRATPEAANADEILERLGASREGPSSDEAQCTLASVGPNATPRCWLHSVSGNSVTAYTLRGEEMVGILMTLPQARSEAGSDGGPIENATGLSVDPEVDSPDAETRKLMDVFMHGAST